VIAEPYWRSHVKVLRSGRLEWYGEEPSEDFWAELWRQRLAGSYFADADRGDLRDLENVLVPNLDREGSHLEAGCGAGYWVAALAARGYRVEGVESSKLLVDAVLEIRPDLPVRHGDALALDYPDGHFAGYLSFGVVEHRREGPHPFLAEARRLLRPGGRLVISVPFLNPLRRAKARLGLYAPAPPADGRPFFQYGFGEEEMAGLLQEHGFTLDEVHHHEVQRCLVEELPLFFRLNRMRGGGVLRRRAVPLVPPRLAAHLLLLVGTRNGG